MKSMILAAGFGTRLRPLTWTLPKPVVPVCNRPLIAWAVDNLLRAGITDLIVNLHHLPDAIERTLHEEYDGRCTLSFSREPEILGTGGALRRVRPLLERERDFFVANGDTIQFPPFEALANARRADDALAALTLRHPPACDRFTAVFFRNALVTGFGKGSGEALMFSGCHCFSSRIFDEIPDRDFSEIVEDVYQPQLDSGRETIAAVVDDGLWFDIGKPQRYIGASEGLVEAMIAGKVPVTPGSHAVSGSIVDDTARIKGRIEHSTVGRGSVIEGELTRSFVWNDCHIGPGVRLTNCIVGHGVEITHAMSIDSAIVCVDDPAIPRDPGYTFEGGLVIAHY